MSMVPKRFFTIYTILENIVLKSTVQQVSMQKKTSSSSSIEQITKTKN